MSKEKIHMYKTITSSLYKELEIHSITTEFSYTEGEQKIPIILENQENLHSFYMGNTNCFWDVNINDLIIERSLTIGSPGVLFGDNGITTLEGELDIGVHIHSRTSNFQTTIPLGETITKESDSKTITFYYNFGSGELKGEIYFEFFIYLKNPIAQAPMFASFPGMKLGELDDFKIAVDGDGSVFPIVEVERPGQPLWNIITNWTDINSDTFDRNNIRIEINSKHSMYSQLYKTTKVSRYLLVEVLSNAISQIIFQVVNDLDYEEDGDLMPDSIMSVVRFWIETFNVETSTLEKINYSLRENIESLFV